MSYKANDSNSILLTTNGSANVPPCRKPSVVLRYSSCSTINSDKQDMSARETSHLQSVNDYKVDQGFCDCIKITPKSFVSSSKFRKCPHQLELILVYIMFFFLGITERGAFLVLFFSLYAYERLTPSETVAVYLFINFLIYTAYPVMGYIADMFFGRYKVILVCLHIVWVGSAIVAASFVRLDPFFNIQAADDLSYNWPVNRIVVLGVGYAMIGIGFTGIRVNLIPFGVDQLPDASSGELSSYFHWYYWCITAGHLLGSVTLPFLYIYAPLSYVFLTMNTGISICIVIFVLFHHKFQILPKIGNPLRLVYRVLKLALKSTKRPLPRSAFLVGQPYPSRIDRTMVHNGGKFSVEQVEDVKTFFRILFILISFVGYFAVFSQVQTTTMLQGLRMQPLSHINCSDDLIKSLTPPHSSNVTVHCQKLSIPPPIGLALSNLFLLVLLIPLFDRVIYICLSGWKWLSMLGRIAIGKLFILATICMALVVEIVRRDYHSQNEDTITVNSFSFHTISSTTLKLASPVTVMLLMPQYWLFAFAELFCNITAVEFIYAQSPSTMKGILLGLFFGMEGVSMGLTGLFIFILGRLPSASFCSFFANTNLFYHGSTTSQLQIHECLLQVGDVHVLKNDTHCSDNALCAYIVLVIVSLLSAIVFFVTAFRYKLRKRELDPYLPIWLIPDTEPEKVTVCQYIFRKICCV